MSATVYRYEFDETVHREDVEASLLLALIGTESLHGETATQLGASHFFDSERRVCIVDVENSAGQDFNSLFAGFVRREFGPDLFRVRRVISAEPTAASAA